MSKEDNKEVALDKLRNVCERILGVDREDVTVDKIFASAPKDMAEDDPKRDLYLGMDQIDAMKFMLYVEQEFNKEIDDSLFVPRKDTVIEDMWRERPVGDLLDFCVETIMD
jgi:acyl carrier protein